MPAAVAWAVGAADPQLPPYRAERAVTAPLGSVGDSALQPLMDAWWAAYAAHQPQARRGRWVLDGDARAAGALMFNLADMALLSRELTPAETAPYAHQFAGDMMKTPLLVRVATREGHAVYAALNQRPGAPLPPAAKEFLSFALSLDGQQIVASTSALEPLDAAAAGAERAKLQGFVAALDPALPAYTPGAAVSGEIRSVGSDGMKALMDQWMRGFRLLQPGVRHGAVWEHLGTLNGFHALLVDQTDLAPMGRELWPAELAAYSSTGHGSAPLEFRVARGGFNTPQRTTAQAVFTHQDNPLRQISLPQLAAVLGQPPTITRWGQLGLGGEWAHRPIRIYMPPQAAPNATSMQRMVLRGGAWNAGIKEGTIAETAAAIARDPAAIGFGGFEEGGPGLKTLAVARDAVGPAIEGDASNAASGRYPLTRYMYIRLNRPAAAAALAQQVKEFLRYVLSREGQEPVLYSGYFPLSAVEVAEERTKLDQLP